jgi:hypothetical protein
VIPEKVGLWHHTCRPAARPAGLIPRPGAASHTFATSARFSLNIAGS